MIRAFDYLFITRPILFFPGWSTLLLGYWLAHFRMTKEQWDILFTMFPQQNEVFLLLAFAMLMGGSFIFNQIRDAESDRINEKLFFIHHDIIPLKVAWIESLFLLLSGFFLLSTLENPALFYTGVLFTIVTAYMYNFRPFVFKDRIVFGLLANMVMGECAFALGYLFVGDLSVIDMLYDSLGILLLNTGLYVLTTLPDIEGDKASKKNTIGGWAGERHGPIIGSLLSFAAFAFLPWGVFWVWILAAVSLPFMLRILIKPNITNSIVALKYTIFILSLVMALYWFWYLFLGLVAFWGTKIYFKKRFALNYPSFSGD